ncbi:aminoglycoside phosphotransferase (APT) family kinase protein [Streptomyces umbrinus]|uniref:Aminoglycoside phosphotransferase (APT) family kinase protein n=1 Tax=Streptomyces umbrinus TaxID=67370 RepID=A0ABU0T6P0_9ACTN|nr:aminoglycoside phosphotransferase family protein [Streptomyces umbrinus]MDQ1031455.1 aminoglycoside phosphotransferase (APT) family kinase protein [Streptomyces umbrinus]
MTVAQASEIPRLAGLATVVADHSWPGTSATVLRLLDPGGRQMILKHNTSKGSFQREHAALARWTEALGASAPQLLDADEAEQDLLMTSVAGRPLALLSLTRRQEHRAYGLAGELLARFHHAAAPSTLPHFGRDRAVYIRAQLAAGTAPLTAAEADMVHEALDLLTRMPPQQTQPSHLDFTSRNILAHPCGRPAGVVDFETSRHEACGRDFLRITQRTLLHRPDLRQEFYRGYGRQPDAAERELIRICTVTDAAAIAVTATAQRRHAFAAEARRTLTAALRTWPEPAPGTAVPHARRLL